MEGTYVTVDIVRVNGVAAFLRGKLDPLGHDGANIPTPHIHPSLIPIVHGLAQVCFAELARIRAPFLVGAGAEVANDLLPQSVQLGDGLGRVVEDVNVVHVDVGLDGRLLAVRTEFQRRLEHNLP